MGFDEAERLRRRVAGREDDATRRAGSVEPPRTRVGKVVTGGGSAGVKSYKVRAYDVLGAETEGSTGTLEDAGFDFFATNLGTTAPAADLVAVFTFVDYRWVFRT